MLLFSTQIRSVWAHLLRVEIIEQNIPVPGLKLRAIDSLSSPQLESIVLKSLRLHVNWTALFPSPTNRCRIVVSRVEKLHFLTRFGHPYLISITLNTPDDDTRTIKCWDLLSNPPTCVATRRALIRGPILLNHDQDSPGVLAIHLAAQ